MSYHARIFLKVIVDHPTTLSTEYAEKGLPVFSMNYRNNSQMSAEPHKYVSGHDNTNGNRECAQFMIIMR